MKIELNKCSRSLWWQHACLSFCPLLLLSPLPVFFPSCPLSPLHWQTVKVKRCLQNVNICPILFVFASVFFFVFFLQPFGVNQPGPYVMYTTLDSNGYLKNASGRLFLFSISFCVSFHLLSWTTYFIIENFQRGICFSVNVNVCAFIHLHQAYYWPNLLTMTVVLSQAKHHRIC